MRRTPFFIGTFVLPLVLAAYARSDEVDDYVTAQIAAKRIPGASIAVIRDGKITKTGAYGMASLELEAPARVDTVYEIGSITKPFTAITAMKLVEDGKVALDDPISKYLSDLPEPWQNVTVRQLLNHTSGIPSYTSAMDFTKLARGVWTPKEILKLVRDKDMDFTPGEKWAYNNSGYFLLGLVIEKASGKSYPEALKATVLEPLGMSLTRPGGPIPVVKHRAHGHGRGPLGTTSNRDPLQPTAAFSAGFLLSTVEDLAKFDAAIRERKILSTSSYEEMWQPTKLAEKSEGEKTQPYGFGFGLGDRVGHKYIHHGGGTAGFSTMWVRFLDPDLAVIVFTNIDGGAAEGLAMGIAGLVDPALRLRPEKPEEDKEPESTKAHREVIANLLGNKPVEEFTTEFKKFMDDPARKRMSQGLAARGKMESFEFLRQLNDGRTRLYLLRIGADSFLVTFNLTEDQKISGLRIQPGD
jgi:CubicO group peptidase (beta-lactamase class C family)